MGNPLPRRNVSDIPVRFCTTGPIPADVSSGTLDELRSDIAGAQRIAVDTETRFRPELNVDNIPGELRVISLTIRRGDGSETSWVLDMRDIPAADVADIFAPLVVDSWNANFDERVFAMAGLKVKLWWDAMIADATVDLGLEGLGWYRGLAVAARRYLGIDVTGKGTTQTSYDLTSDLSTEQVLYAAQDTTVTLWVADFVRERMREAAVEEAVELELGGRAFINEMMTYGLPFDYAGYRASLNAREERVVATLHTLAELTDGGAGQGNLFDPTLVPGWNPRSAPDLRSALNRWSEPEVRAYTGGRLMMVSDKVDKAALKAIGGELCTLVLALREEEKIISTYGDNLEKFTRAVTNRNGVTETRFFGRYKQALVATGRLASFNFNMQNLSPSMKKYLRTPEGRVFVYGDLSQAEIRGLAAMADEKVVLEKFAAGEDIHLATAKLMFGAEFMDELAVSDPAAFAKKRSGAKFVNFGLPYGIAAGALSSQMTTAGVETSKDEAQELLDGYYGAHKANAKWLRDRDAYVKSLSKNVNGIDWKATLRLHELRGATDTDAKRFRKEHGHVPTGDELARYKWTPGDVVNRLGELAGGNDLWTAKVREDLAAKNGVAVGALSNDDVAAAERELIEAEYSRRAVELDWARGYEASVVLSDDGTPYSFESRTVSGRRRIFNVPMDNSGTDKFGGLITSVVLSMCTTDKPAGAKFRDEFAAKHNLTGLPTGVPQGRVAWKDRLAQRNATVEVFSGTNKPLKVAMIREAIAHFGFDAMVGFLNRGLGDCVKGLGNAYRNHPIQGLVADVMERAFERLTAQLPEGAYAVMSVHDSVVIECDEADAQFVAELLKFELEEAMSHYCPTVVAKADVDVRRSLSDDDVLYELKVESPVAA